MNAWLRHHAHALRRAVRRVGLLNVLVIGVALALPAGGYALIESLRAVSGRLALDPQISLFLDAKRADAASIASALRRDARISRVRFVPREQALKELGSVQGLSDLVAALGRNPLPDVFVVTAREQSIEPLAAELARLPGVAHVQADALWARRLASLARVARVGLWLLAGLLGVALVAVTFNTIRLQILTQRDEIVLTEFILEDGAFAEPAAGAHAGQRYGFAGPRDGGDLQQAVRDAGPRIETIAAMKYISALGERLLDDAAARALEFGAGQVAGPERNLAQMLG